jgi:hypothetical protein
MVATFILPCKKYQSQRYRSIMKPNHSFNLFKESNINLNYIGGGKSIKFSKDNLLAAKT